MNISIVTPCYNAENFIKQCIESVLAQDYSNFEFIIVDDGSTDNSVNVIEQYALKDQRIVLISQKNSGKPSIARNRGIKQSSGDILTFIDADDTMLPTKLSSVAAAFTENDNIDLVGHDYCRIDAQGNILDDGIINAKWLSEDMESLFTPCNKYWLSSEQVYLYFLTHWIFLHVNSISIKKDRFLLDELLFDETLIFAEDISKWCQLLCNRQLILIKTCLATYRDTPNSLMTDQLKADLAAISFYESNLSKPLEPLSKLTIEVIHHKIVKEIKDVIYGAAQQGKLKLVYKFSKKLHQYQPSLNNFFYLIKQNFIALLKGIF